VSARAAHRLAAVAACLPALAGCAGVQSALAPGAEEARSISGLFWTVTGIGAGVLALVLALTGVALWAPERWRAPLARNRVVLGGGLVLPVVVLSGLLVYGLSVLQAGETRHRAASGAPITVVGKRWWWEVVYPGPAGAEIVSANELRLPVGEPVALRLESDNVIHSFWVPRLAGKLDMIPGRTNLLTLLVDEPGVSRGQCAEYCGGAHALMSFYVVALPPAEHAAWLAREAAPARPPESAAERLGQALFLESGCGACHRIRGTAAAGTIGPDLTHVGSRMSLAAAALPNTAEAFARWIVGSQHIKPENLMPPYAMFDAAALAALGAYLESLE
jgi:cytochrome c oxidase subunit II